MADSLDALFGYGESFGITHEVMRHVLYSNKPLRNFSRHKCIGDIDTTGFYAIDHKELYQITRQMPLYSAEIEVKPGQWVTIFSCHLRSSAYSTARKQMNVDANWIDGVPLYYRNYRIGKLIRDFEADNVRRYVDSIINQAGQAVIVAGDFNDWSGSYCMDKIQDNDLKDVWWAGGNGFGFTYNGWHLRLRLDHILYSEDFEPCGVKIIESDISDHRALVADFRLN
jgi:endonuclease/exonuclease/phosphatase family metal-dependent hydrolase